MGSCVKSEVHYHDALGTSALQPCTDRFCQAAILSPQHRDYVRVANKVLLNNPIRPVGTVVVNHENFMVPAGGTAAAIAWIRATILPASLKVGRMIETRFSVTASSLPERQGRLAHSVRLHSESIPLLPALVLAIHGAGGETVSID